MSKGTLYRAGALLAVATAMLAVTPALAGSARQATKKKATVVVRCKDQLVPNRFFKEGCRFFNDVNRIRAGGTLTIRNRSDEPHTFSIVRRSDQPRNIRQGGKCFEGGVCGQLAGAHGLDDQGNVANPTLNVGAPGLDAKGDSLFFGPKQTVKVNVSAKAGTKLYFMCILHPQMQARLDVKKK
jgi:hypothetical protein